MAAAPSGVAASSFRAYSAAALAVDRARDLLNRPGLSCRLDIAAAPSTEDGIFGKDTG